MSSSDVCQHPVEPTRCSTVIDLQIVLLTVSYPYKLHQRPPNITYSLQSSRSKVDMVPSCLAVFLFSLSAFTRASINDTLAATPERFRRQLGFCSWGQPAVSACHRNGGGFYCGYPGYRCDPFAGPGGRCCRSTPALTTTSPNTVSSMSS